MTPGDLFAAEISLREAWPELERVDLGGWHMGSRERRSLGHIAVSGCHRRIRKAAP
jgi:hypothetical protein